jgi:hypothetical protein
LLAKFQCKVKDKKDANGGHQDGNMDKIENNISLNH